MTTHPATTPTLAVFPAARHARLTVDDARALFGAQLPRALLRLSDGSDAADAVVEVEGPRGRLAPVRVVLPYVDVSAVYVTGFDADAPGCAAGAACAVVGPAGAVAAVVVRAAERVVVPAPSSTRADVHVEGERPRLLRGLPVERGDVAAVYVVDVSGELRPGTTAIVV